MCWHVIWQYFLYNCFILIVVLHKNLKSPWRTFNWFWSSLNELLIPHILSTSVRRLETTIMSFTMSLSSLSQQKCYKTLYGTQTGRRDLLFTSMIDPLFFFALFHSFSLSMVGNMRTFFVRYVWYFEFMAKTSLVQISDAFLSLSSKTNACARQDLNDSKQYCFCPQAPLQSTWNRSSSEKLWAMYCICWILNGWLGCDVSGNAGEILVKELFTKHVRI